MHDTFIRCDTTQTFQSIHSDLIKVFEEQVKRTPNNIAIVFVNEKITYKKLNDRANCLAHRLIQLGVKSGTVVGILLNRNINTIISILSILKTGGAYLPIEPHLPLDRICFMLNNCNAPILITETSLFSLSSHISNLCQKTNLLIIENEISSTLKNKKNPQITIKENSLAYIIYTSGSTGEPKGVMVTHRNVINYIRWFSHSFDFNEKSIFDFSSPLAFDFSVTCTLLPLMYGGCISIATKESKDDPRAYLQYLKQNKVTHIKLTPSYFSQLVNTIDKETRLPNLHWIILGGEPVIKKDIKQWIKEFLHHYIVNEYGPTETTVATSAYTVTKDNIDKYTGVIPIGKPSFNTQFYVLNKEKNPVNLNEIGELYIGGDSVSKGYLNQPKLTNECFIKNKFSKQNKKLYKTGDLVRQLSDGNFEYIGRVDSQVKVRGFRIELNEIENCLLKHPSVQQSIAITRQKNSYRFALIAYVVFKIDRSIDPEILRKFLRQTLPDYMIPNTIIILKQLPLTQNGKIDKAALPLPSLDNNRIIISPRDPVEKNIRDIFAKVLHQDPNLISTEDDFFAIGGDSLLAMQIILQCRKILNLEFPAHFLFENPTIASLYEQIKQEKLNTEALPPLNIIAAKERYQPYPLSYAQQRLWFLQQLQPNSPYYNVFLALELSGSLDSDALAQAFSALVHKHESLRTQFRVNQQGQPYQVVLPKHSVAFSVSIEDFSNQPELTFINEAHNEAQKPFNLEKAPLLRVRLLKYNTKKHYLFITFHHIIIDGTSIHLLFKELSSCYSAYYQHRIITPQINALDYLDFALWQREWLTSSASLKTQKQYWQEQLKDLPSLELITDYRRPLTPSYKGCHHPFKINFQLTQRLRNLAKTIPTTLFVTLLTGFFIVLSRYTQQDDIAIGTPNASRHYPNLESVIGFFINLLILRCKFNPSTDILSLLKENHRTLIQAFANQDVPFEQIVEALHPSREATTNPLCSTLFVFQNYAHEPLTLTGLEVQRVFSDNNSLLFGDYESSKFDLTLYLQENPDGLEGLIEYNTDLFQPNTVARIANHFQNVLSAMVENPNHLVHNLPLLTQQEEKAILYHWNQTEMVYPHDQTVSQLFAIQAKKTPQNIALIFNNQSLTYNELQEKIDRLVDYLLEQGICSGSLVAVCLERNFYMPIALLALLKIGAAYIPIDPSYPQERIKQIIKSSKTHTLLVNNQNLDVIKNLGLNTLKILSIENCEYRSLSQKNPADFSQAQQLAYVLYTSGTTGIPKGVAITHSSLVNFLLAMQKELNLTSQDNVLALTPYIFDISGLEIYLPLILGATCVLVDKATASNGELLNCFLKKHPISVLQTTPANWYLLLQSGWKGNDQIKILCGGEALSLSLGKQLLESTSHLWNVYGPTEATIWSTIEKVTTINEKSASSLVPIGKPIANTRAYVLDQNKQLSLIGCIGELYLAGDGLAKEYLHDPNLSAERFISSPLTTIQESKLYKTGDMVRWLADGRLEYLGRRDKQAKIRGFRIELSEIETWLLNHSAVSQAVVVVQGNSLENERLLAYVVLAPENTKTNRYEACQTEQIEHWKTIYNETYRQVSNEKVGLITAGWNSSYTNQPIPLMEMQKWIDTTVERILALQPKRILEIGCGTGMLLLRLLPHCEFYCATDIAEKALAHNQAQIAKLGIPVNFELLQRPAHILEERETKTYDTVVINSVIQYFPDVNYLLRVLDNAITSVRAGGHIFIGDVRSLIHLEAFCAAVQLTKATSKTTIQMWKTAIEKQMQQEEELVLSPAFFHAFAAYHPRISGVTIQLKRGQFVNEITQFRYDVILYIEQETCPIEPTNWISWKEKHWQSDEIQVYLSQKEPAYLALRDLPNPRLRDIEKILQCKVNNPQDYLLTSIEATKVTSESPFIDLETLWQIENCLPYFVEIHWSDKDPLKSLDVIFRHKAYGFQKSLAHSPQSRTDFILQSKNLTNNPMKEKWQRQTLTLLRHYLEKKLPYYMVPSLFIAVESIPLTANGKIAYNLLPSPSQSEAHKQIVSPRNDIESKMLALWLELLHLDTLSIEDNFFDKGGHSLLAVQLIAKIKDAFQINLGINTLFEAPTIAKLSNIIKKKNDHYSNQISIKIKSELNVKAETLVTLNSQGKQSPLFLFHPIGGSVLCYGQLNQQLQLDRPLYAFQDPSLIARKIYFSSIEEMAHFYCTELLKIQPKGPYYLGGYSMGGILAIEVATQLLAQKKTIKWLGLLDSWAYSADNSELAELFYLRRAAQYKKFEEKLKSFPYDNVFIKKLYQHHATLLANYHLLPFHCPIHLFKAIESNGITANEASNYWEIYARSTVNVYQTPGNHETILTEPQVIDLAKQMKHSLKKPALSYTPLTNHQYADKYKAGSDELLD